VNNPMGDTPGRDSRSRIGRISHADSELVITAEETMREALHPSIFNHTMRVLHLAWHLPAQQPAPDQEALSVAVLFHDSGTIEENNGEQRFEVEGADAAARFLERWDWTPERIKPVWEAIALHTSPGIAERFGPLAQLVRAAVLIDLGRTDMPVASTPALDSQLARYPRLDIDRVLPDMVVAQALERGGAMKAPPSSWPGLLVADHLAGTERRDGTTSTSSPCPAVASATPESLGRGGHTRSAAAPRSPNGSSHRS
jgi:HD superfamily phosphohydrolase YqeK